MLLTRPAMEEFFAPTEDEEPCPFRTETTSVHVTSSNTPLSDHDSSLVPAIGSSSSDSSGSSSRRETPPSCSQVMEVYSPPYAHMPPHTHPGPARHIILSGSLTIAYPLPHKPSTAQPAKKKPMLNDDRMQIDNDDEVLGKRFTYHAGQHFDIPGGTTYEVFTGPDGCRKLMVHNLSFEPPVGIM